MGQRLDALAHLVIHVREGELRALPMHRLRDAPRDRAVGRNPDDEGALAGEKSHKHVPPGGDYAGKGHAASGAANPRSASAALA